MGDESCIATDSSPDMHGSALLQANKEAGSIVLKAHEREKREQRGRGRRSDLFAYQGAPTCLPKSQQYRHSLLQRSHCQMKSSAGEDAPLDASGFKDVTSLCCPPQMEIFFNRLLDSRGYNVCSRSHVQGLMHWFSCVPEMDFQYVLDVIANGNPCKYWAPMGQDCPVLSP